MEFLIVCDEYKAQAQNLALKVREWCTKRGIFTLDELNDANDKTTAAIVLGGDGFITRTSLKLAAKNIPFLGVNFGTVGFLAAAEPDNWQDALQKLAAGQFSVEQKKILRGLLIKGSKKEKFSAVNDVVATRGLEKFIHVRVEISGHTVFEDIGGDGVIISSAVGSTAYNLSAGGPISESGLIVTPLAAHRINIVPLVLKEERTVEIICLETSKPVSGGFVLEVDGDNTRRILPGDRVVVRYGRPVIRFIVPEGFIFIQSLQKKLGLSR